MLHCNSAEGPIYPGWRSCFQIEALVLAGSKMNLSVAACAHYVHVRSKARLFMQSECWHTHSTHTDIHNNKYTTHTNMAWQKAAKTIQTFWGAQLGAQILHISPNTGCNACHSTGAAEKQPHSVGVGSNCTRRTSHAGSDKSQPALAVTARDNAGTFPIGPRLCHRQITCELC